MVTLSSLTIPSNPNFRVQPFRCQPCPFRKCSKTYFPRHTFYTSTTLIKASAANHDEPDEVKMQIGIVKEKLKEAMPKLIEAMPSPVQEFPWRNAQHTLLDRLLLLVQEALKWSIVVYFIFSTLSDVVYTFSINRELIIPVGLFVGCLIADFSKEISLELFRGSEENDWRRLGLCGLFVLVKLTSTWFSTQPGVFLLHVANGGLMQLLWHWRNFIEDAKNRQEMSTPSGLDA
jgi:myb proto-oncogene protein